MQCITSTSLNVLWNGSKIEEFAPTWGLRQGDLLSLYIFMLCMEKLTHLISDVVQDKRWIPLKVGKQGPFVSQLKFANDLILFGEVTKNQMEALMDCLYHLCLMCSQRVN